MAAPKHLNDGGKALWEGVTAEHDLDAAQLVTLEAACKQRDRADQLRVVADSGEVTFLRQERDASLAMARLIAALRLPDAASGKRPQARQMRGVQKPSKTGESKDRLRVVRT